MYTAESGVLDESSPRMWSPSRRNTSSRARALRRVDASGKRCGGQVGEVTWFVEVLLPCPRAFHDPQPQRVMVIGQRGQHCPHIVSVTSGARRKMSGTRH